jgi:Ca2+-binding RTX toxin-like protein
MKPLALAPIALLLTFAAPASAATVSLTVRPPGGLAILSYSGAPGEANDVTVNATGSARTTGWVVRDESAALEADAGCSRLDDHTAFCPRPELTTIVRADLGDGDDFASLAGACGYVEDDDDPCPGVTVYGGEGNDVIVANDIGFRPTSIVLGGPGDDSLFAGESGSTMYGNGGDDLLVGAGSQDRLFGQNGEDELRGAGGDDILYVRFGGRDMARGGPGRDRTKADRSDALRSVERVELPQ